MRIVQLTAENLMRLKAVDITPEGDVVIVAGRNAQGKTSVLNAIWMGLAGAAGAKETTKPIRKGEERASVRIDLGEFVVTRKWTESGSTLAVSANGATYNSPQTMLDGLIGKLSFDPLAFANQDPKGQRETLLGLVELPFNPDELAERRRRTFDERTEVNRDLKLYAAQVEAFEEPAADTPDEEVSVTALMDELDAATKQNGERLALLNEMGRAERQVEEDKAALEAVKAKLAAAESYVKSLAKKPLPDEVDAEPIRERMAAVDETNKRVRDKAQRSGLVGDRDRLKEKSDELTAELEAIDREKVEGLAGADMPLDGLAFDDEGVLYNGVPFSQASASEQLRVGVAIAMAVNPKIRVIRISDGSLLDSDSMAMIEALAGEQDFQVWVERVDESGKVGVVIEDGMVANGADA